MKIGDVSRHRRFANPARLRWYAFHRSVRFALRMMKAGEAPCPSAGQSLQSVAPIELIPVQQPVSDSLMKVEGVELEEGPSIVWASRQGSGCLP
jgi:hypothetical protein